MEINLSEERFARMANYIETQYGIRIPPEKKIMLQSRLLKRVMELGCKSVDDYVDLVLARDAAAEEVNRMMTLISTHLTFFFREPVHFTILANRIIPEMVQRFSATKQEPLLVWSAACSTGEEAWTLAMVLEEARNNLPPEQRRNFEYAVLGTDLALSVIEQAREGIYPDKELDAIPEPYRSKYVMHSRSQARFRIVPELRERVFFRTLNLMDVPYDIQNAVHLVFCRNVLIYFSHENQHKVVEHMHRRIEPGGFLVVGHAESLLNMNVPFRTVASTMYQKNPGGHP